MSLFVGFSEKMNIFGGVEILLILLLVITKLDYIQGSFLCTLWYFLKV